MKKTLNVDENDLRRIIIGCEHSEKDLGLVMEDLIHLADPCLSGDEVPSKRTGQFIIPLSLVATARQNLRDLILIVKCDILTNYGTTE